MKIEIPSETPNGRKVETVGIWMSGGADSTILAYLLCKDAKTRGRGIKIQPFTVRRPRPTNPMYAMAVFEKIEEILDYKMEEHVVYYPDLSDPEHADGPFFGEMNDINFSQNKIQLLYSGLTMNPPVAVQETFVDGVNKEEWCRGENSDRKVEWYSTDKGYEFWQLDPLININKQGLAEIYRREGLMDSLFPLTRSCESTDTLFWTEHCGTCWWCEERMWGFGRLE